MINAFIRHQCGWSTSVKIANAHVVKCVSSHNDLYICPLLSFVGHIAAQ